MRDRNDFVLRDAEVFTLYTCGGDEFGRRDIGSGDSVFFEISDIVRTARNTGSSRADGFDHPMTTGENVFPHFWFRHTSRRRFGVTHDCGDAIPLFEERLYAIEKNLAVGKADIKERNRFPLQA